MERLGAVIVFKPHVSKQEADAILEHLCIEKNVIELGFEGRSLVHEYDDYGGTTGPVWYIP